MTLAASNLTIERKDEFYLNNISFEMSPGKIYTIIGRTLSGKTTLLKTIAGLISQDSGKLTFNANTCLEEHTRTYSTYGYCGRRPCTSTDTSP